MGGGGGGGGQQRHWWRGGGGAAHAGDYAEALAKLWVWGTWEALAMSGFHEGPPPPKPPGGGG